MKCGEFDKRNEEYNKCFSADNYFRRLVLGSEFDKLSTECSGAGKVIFDVGAHRGESALFFHEVFPEADIFSFEPTPVAASAISELSIPNVTVCQMALSDFDGIAEFNVQDISHLSSLHKINRESKQSLGYAEKETHSTVKVDVFRGDSFCDARNIEKIDLLKVDVQANEVQTIKGFSSVLDKVGAVFVEVSLYDFYENRSSIKLIEETLPDFELYDIYEISKNPKTLGTDWATLVYKNAKFKL